MMKLLGMMMMMEREKPESVAKCPVSFPLMCITAMEKMMKIQGNMGKKEKPESVSKCPVSLTSLSSSGWVTISHSPPHLNNHHRDDYDDDDDDDDDDRSSSAIPRLT